MSKVFQTPRLRIYQTSSGLESGVEITDKQRDESSLIPYPQVPDVVEALIDFGEIESLEEIISAEAVDNLQSAAYILNNFIQMVDSRGITKDEKTEQEYNKIQNTAQSMKNLADEIRDMLGADELRKLEEMEADAIYTEDEDEEEEVEDNSKAEASA